MNNSQNQGDEVINFPVPKRFLPVVVQALAKAMEIDAAHTSHSSEASAQVQSNHNGSVLIDWTSTENCKNLRHELRYAGAKTMLDLTAARPDELVSFSEVVLASERSEKQVRADLGALTKAIRRLFGVSRDNAKWPVEFRWAAGGEEQAYYVMRPEIAKAWIQSEKQ